MFRPPLLAAALAALLAVPLLAQPPGEEGLAEEELADAVEPAPPETWTADDFAGWLIAGDDEYAPLKLIGEVRVDEQAKVVLRDALGNKFSLDRNKFETILKRVGEPVPEGPGATFTPRYSRPARFEGWGEDDFEALMRGERPEFAAAIPFGLGSGNRSDGLYLVLPRRYVEEPAGAIIMESQARDVLEARGLSLEIGRRYEPGEGSPEMRWNERDVRQFLKGLLGGTRAEITAIDGRNVTFALALPPDLVDEGEPATVRRTAAAADVQRAFGAEGVPAETYRVGAVFEPPAGDSVEWPENGSYWTVEAFAQLLRTTTPERGRFEWTKFENPGGGYRSAFFEFQAGPDGPVRAGRIIQIDDAMETLRRLGWDSGDPSAKATEPAPHSEPAPRGVVKIEAEPGDTRVTDAAGTRKTLDLWFGETRPAALEAVSALRLGPTVGGKTRADLLDATGKVLDWLWLDEAALEAWRDEEGLEFVPQEGFEIGLGDSTPPAVLPGRWTAADLERFLRGEASAVARVYVDHIPTNAEAGRPGRDGHFPDEAGLVYLILYGDSPGTGQAVEIAVEEARRALGRFGLSMVEGETLRPVPESDRPSRSDDAPLGEGESDPAAVAALGAGGDAYLDRLAKKAADSDGDAREAALSDLKSTLGDRFDAAQADRETDLAALEAKVKRLRELHDKRAAAKAGIVARRAEALLRAAEGLGWEDPAGSGGGSGGRLSKEVPAGGGGLGGGLGGNRFGGGFGGGFGGAGRGGEPPATADTAVGTVTNVDTAGGGVPVLDIALNTSVFVSDGDRLAVVGGPGRAARDGRGLTLGTLTVIGGDGDTVRGSFRSEGGGPVRVDDRVIRRTDPPGDAPDDGGNRDEP